MPFSGPAIAYTIVGGLIAYSGIKGATLSDTAKSVLSGNLNLSDTQTVSFGSDSGTGNTSSNSGSNTSGPSSGGGDAAANQALAKKIIQANSSYAGWDTGTEWQDLVNLWNQESDWNQLAKNSSSGAYGIPQSLPADKMAVYGSDYLTNPATQIKWGLDYIKGRYGSPSMAWGHERQYDWY